MSLEELFLDIKTALALTQKERRMTQDRYMRDYSAAWGAQSTENGGINRDDIIPESYAQECINLAKGLVQHPITGRWVKDRKLTTQWRGGSVEVSQSGGIIIRQGTNEIQVITDDFDAFLTDMQDAMATQPKPSGATVGFGGQSSYDDRPEVKRRMLQNLDTMQKWALASSKRFPNSR
jgi:hypothetical protein